jgi:Uma2 family endonuclease
MATATKTLVTAEEFERMEFPEKAELVRGEVVEMTNPAPDHGQICSNVSELLMAWSPRRSKGRVLTNDSRVQTGHNPDTVRGPDVFFIANDRLPPGGLTNRSLQVPPDLAVEVFSPSDRWRRVHEKVGDYLAAGVREVWVLHLRRREVHVFRPDEAPVTLADNAELTTDVLPGFRCKVADFFAGL